MKKILLTMICLLLLCAETKAQENKSKPYKPKREFAVRIGAIPLDHMFDEWEDNHRHIDHWWSIPLERYNSGKYCLGEKFHTPTFILSYTQELKRWLGISLSASYHQNFRREYDMTSDKMTGKYKEDHFSIFPTIRFTCLNKPIIRIYSAVGIGLRMERSGWTQRGQYDTENELEPQITFFGISVGKELFISCELGIGQAGLISVGGGYRF